MVQHKRPQTIAIVGFGNFGQFLAKTFVAQGHRVIGQSRSDYSEVAKALGAEYYRTADELLDCDPEVVILCTSIMSLKTVLSKFPLERLLEMLPESADILCTHPMFGPESGKDSWRDLPFVYEVVRVKPEMKSRTDDFIKIWELEGCSMVPMSCEQHDAYAASTQFVTHTTGLSLESTPINTKGFQSLLGVINTTEGDSFDLYYGLFKYNKNSESELTRLENSLKALREKLEAYDKEMMGKN